MHGVRRKTVFLGSPFCRALREFLDKWLPLHSDFDAFCIDHFDKLSRQFGSSWDLLSKQSLLISTIPSEHLLTALRHHLIREPNALNELTEIQRTLSPQEKERQALSVQLDLLCQQKAQLLSQGQVNTELDERIRTIKQQLRRTPQLQGGESLNDRYKLLSLLGRGGFARVYQAYDLQSKSLVAVKVLHSDASEDPRRLARFERGARQMEQLNHPHIVRVLHGPADHEGFHFFVMEYLSGGDLARAITDSMLGSLEKLRIILEVGAALQFAHQRNLIHRDVKPENILLTYNFQAKLTDFDLVWTADSTGGTNSKAGFGTYLYAAPEQLTDAGTVTPSADVYSLAMVAIFLLIGKIPVWFREHRQSVIYTLPLSRDSQNILDRATHSEPVYRPKMDELLRILAQSWPIDRTNQLHHKYKILKDHEYHEPSQKTALIEPIPTVKYPFNQPIKTDSTNPINNPQKNLNQEKKEPKKKQEHPEEITLDPAEQKKHHRSSKNTLSTATLLMSSFLVVGYVTIKSTSYQSLIDANYNETKQLAAIDHDLQKQQWSSAIEKTNSLINNQSVSASLRQTAKTKRKQAIDELRSKEQYLKLESAVAASNLNEIITIKASIPQGSFYFDQLEHILKSELPNVIEIKLKNAISAREQGNCDVFREQINQILSIDPSHQRALDEQAKPCESGQSTAVTPPKSSPPKEKKSRAQRPNSINATAPAQPDSSATEVRAPKTEDVLAEAQAEFMNGNYDKAIKLAQSVSDVSTNISWRIIGSSACRTKNLPLVNLSYRVVDNAAKQFLIDVCQREGIVLIGSSFQIVE